jgi:hypothetical protein
MQSDIKRIVHGSPDSPDSRRDITGIAPREYMHLIESLQVAFKDAVIITHLSDEEVEKVIEAYRTLAAQHDLPGFTGPVSIPDFRVYQEERIAYLSTLLEKLNQPYPGMVYPLLSDGQSSTPSAPEDDFVI